LDEQTKAESFFRLSSIPIKAKHFPELKALIEEFVQSMTKKESAKEADEVYLLSVPFCRLTSK
jgi:hypothetical protein